jgi:hypothetical protein
VAAGKISVSAMQVGFDAGPSTQRWLRKELDGFLNR